MLGLLSILAQHMRTIETNKNPPYKIGKKEYKSKKAMVADKSLRGENQGRDVIIKNSGLSLDSSINMQWDIC